MDLWIRSQDRYELRKVKGVVMAQEGKFFAIYPVVKDLGELEILGHYKSEERALEVLGEIQKLLVGDLLVFTNTDFEEGLADYVKPYNAIAVEDKENLSPRVEFVHRDCIVYEMPQE